MTAKWFGCNFPFYKGSMKLGSSGAVLPRQEDSRLVKNDILQGLMTVKGERWFRPIYGGNVPNYLFDPHDVVSSSGIINSITDHLNRFEPRISVSEVTVEQDPVNQNVANVKIYGNLNLDASNKNTLIMDFQIPVSGA